MLCGMAAHTMSHASSPKAKVLGAALRTAREEQDISLRKLAGELDLDPSALSKWERGVSVPKEVVVAQILTYLGVTGERYEEILQMPATAGASQWIAGTLPEQRQHQAAMLDAEGNASLITQWSPLLIPGLAQTGAYARAIMSGGTVPADEISTRVAVRIGRRDVITRTDPAQLVALVGEAALRQIIGSRDVMLGQLEFLLELAELPNVDLRIVPFGSGWHPGLEGSFDLIDPQPTATDDFPVVVLENRRSGLILHVPEDVAAYQQAVEAVLRAAMSPADSAKLIAAVIKEMRTG